MSQKTFSDFVLLSSTVIFISSIALALSFKSGQDQANSTARESQIYQTADARPKYSYGSCTKNSDCTPAGCSSQICSSEPKLLTTCEFAQDFPDKKVYTCGCLNKTCVWYK